MWFEFDEYFVVPFDWVEHIYDYVYYN